MSTIALLKPPSQAMIDAHRRLLSLPGVRADAARTAQIRELLRSWGVDPDLPATPTTEDDGWTS